MPYCLSQALAKMDKCGVALESKLRYFCWHRRQVWGRELQEDWVLELDSSTPVKFSRHVVIQIPGHAFASCQMVGNFVASLLASSEV